MNLHGLVPSVFLLLVAQHGHHPLHLFFFFSSWLVNGTYPLFTTTNTIPAQPHASHTRKKKKENTCVSQKASKVAITRATRYSSSQLTDHAFHTCACCAPRPSSSSSNPSHHLVFCNRRAHAPTQTLANSRAMTISTISYHTNSAFEKDDTVGKHSPCRLPVYLEKRNKDRRHSPLRSLSVEPPSSVLVALLARK